MRRKTPLALAHRLRSPIPGRHDVILSTCAPHLQIAEMRDDIRQGRTAVEQRVETLERRLAAASLWIRIGMSLNVILLIVILGLLLRK